MQGRYAEAAKTGSVKRAEKAEDGEHNLQGHRSEGRLDMEKRALGVVVRDINPDQLGVMGVTARADQMLPIAREYFNVPEGKSMVGVAPPAAVQRRLQNMYGPVASALPSDYAKHYSDLVRRHELVHYIRGRKGLTDQVNQPGLRGIARTAREELAANFGAAKHVKNPLYKAEAYTSAPLEMAYSLVANYKQHGGLGKALMGGTLGKVVGMFKRAEKAEDGEHDLQGHIDFQGLRIAVENRKGSVRSGKTPDGHEWHTKMHAPYGYVEAPSKGKDGESIDVYVGPKKDADTAFVVHQHKPDGTGHDEDKVMLGVESEEEARRLYLQHYDDPKFLGPISAVAMDRFKRLVNSGRKLTKISAFQAMAAEIEKEAFQTSQYSGPLSYGAIPSVSSLPDQGSAGGLQATLTNRTARRMRGEPVEKLADVSPASSWDGGTGYYAPQVSSLPNPEQAGALQAEMTRLVAKALEKRSGAALSPASRLAATRAVGAPKLTFPGPPISSIVKPVGPGWGHAIPGAKKGTI